MRNPFRAMLKASQLSRKGRPVSAALVLQKALLPAPKPKRKRSPPKPKRPTPAPIRRAITISRPTRPAPGSFIAGRHDAGHGVLGYRLYTPAGSARRRMPLVVMLHGCTQSATDFATGTGMNALADELGFLVLYPEQSPSANLNRCWNWHRPVNQRRGGGEPAAIAALTLHVISACRANPARVYIAGISAGGTAAAITASAYPDIYAAVGVHSAVSSGNVSTLPAALSAMRNGGAATVRSPAARALPMIVFHGDCDNVVNVSNASGYAGGFAGSKARPITGEVRRGRSKGGRDFTRTLYRSVKGEIIFENWTIHGGGHAWFGGNRAGSHTDPAGPNASREIMRFFLARRSRTAGTKLVRE